MRLDVLQRVSRIRWIFLPFGMCALVAVGAHAAADVVGDRVMWVVDKADALFDAVFSSWSVTAPLVDLVGLSQRTFFARAAALTWELLADVLIALPLLGYDERPAADEWIRARLMLKKKPTPRRLARPIATVLVAVAGTCSVARMVQGSVQLSLHSSWAAHLAAAGTLLALLVLLVPRAAFRSLEHADEKGRAIAVGVFGTAVLAPMMVAAIAASPLLSFFR